jgi:hypothetical protein
MEKKRKKAARDIMCHKVDYELIGDDIQIVEVELDPGGTVISKESWPRGPDFVFTP